MIIDIEYDGRRSTLFGTTSAERIADMGYDEEQSRDALGLLIKLAVQAQYPHAKVNVEASNHVEVCVALTEPPWPQHNAQWHKQFVERAAQGRIERIVDDVVALPEHWNIRVGEYAADSVPLYRPSEDWRDNPYVGEFSQYGRGRLHLPSLLCVLVCLGITAAMVWGIVRLFIALGMFR